MAQYKVPQDVEADDKLLGPFSFRQFVYLLIAGGLIALAVGLFQIFPLLVIIPAPFILLFVALALPLKKDQPMETYLVALISYYLKPRKRVWTPGQRESTITITAPKIVEDDRVRDTITGEEATHRLSFLADIVDTEGYAIKGTGVGQMNEDLIVEANTTNDIFETGHFDSLENTIARDENQRHEEVIKEMREAIEETENLAGNYAAEPKTYEQLEEKARISRPDFTSPSVVQPDVYINEKTVTENSNKVQPETNKEVEQKTTKSSIIELADNDVFSVATIAKEANRINERDKNEVFISLH